MDQIKIGQFIQTQRKIKNITQKEVADQIGVSDKTVSKWENGNGMPEITLLPELCKILDISVNELLSGEKLSSDTYSVKAEENMLELLKKNRPSRRKKAVLFIIGCAFLAYGFWFMIFGVYGLHSFWNYDKVYYEDAWAFLVEMFLVGACLLLGGTKWKDVPQEIQKIILPIGGMLTVFLLISVLTRDMDSWTVGLLFSMCLIPMLYACIIYLLAYIINRRIQKL